MLTSPPYPMIELWDQQFSALHPELGAFLAREAGYEAFEAMHSFLDRVWEESYRVLAPGGILCVNVGDATRKLGGHFRLYSNHARILSAAQGLGFDTLPGILWRKPTNAPNKFMGSGMLPGGAYMTLEHEHILIMRKGQPRSFDSQEEKENRRRSAYFWEERNRWFSDLWEIPGVRQGLGVFSQDSQAKQLRLRSAAFPFEIPFRLVAMFSAYGDTVLDPFWGTGTTSAAAIALGRNSQGYEIVPELLHAAAQALKDSIKDLSEPNVQRLEKHQEFIRNRLQAGKLFKYTNRWAGFPVVTAQEQEIILVRPESLLDISPGPQVKFLVDHKILASNDQKSWKLATKQSRMAPKIHV